MLQNHQPIKQTKQLTTMEAIKLETLREHYNNKSDAELKRIFPDFNRKTLRPQAYISYPMTGYANYNIEAEKEAFDKLRFQYQIFTPSKLKQYIDKTIQNPEYKHYLGNDINALSKCDIMFVLDGWQNSKGCLIEINFCHQTGIPVIQFPSMQLLKPEDVVVNNTPTVADTNFEIEKIENASAYETLIFWFVTIGLFFFTLSGIIYWISKLF